MATHAKQFELDLKHFNKKIKKDFLTVQRDAAFQILLRFLSHGRYVGSTPVDTGRAIHGYRVSRGSPITDPSDKETDLLSLKNEVDKLSNYDIIWITNNLPYIKRLMVEGYSKQTPPGAVNLTMEEVLQYLKQKYGLRS